MIDSCDIHDSTRVIMNAAFSGCGYLDSISIPDGIKHIGDYVFEGCNWMEVYTYDNAHYVGNDDNHYMVLIEVADDTIQSCEINENTKFIQGGAFNYCRSLSDVTIPNGVPGIGSAAFTGCTSLKSIEIPDGVKRIES